MMRSILMSGALALLTITAPAAEKELKAWYPMDGNFNDASGNGNHLKALGAKNRFTEDTELKNGKNTVYGPLQTGEGKGAAGMLPGIDLKKGLTMMGFYRHADNNSDGQMVGFGSLKWNQPGYLITISYGIPSIKAGLKEIFRYKRLPSGKWLHLALVIPQESDGDREIRFYVDGKRISVDGKKYHAVYAHCPPDFKLGEASGKRIENKCFDEIKIYNRALSEEEIVGAAEKKGRPAPEPAEKKRPHRISSTIPRFQAPHEQPPIRGMTKILFLDSSNLVFAGYYQKFLQERFQTDCGPFLRLIEQPEYNVQEWSRIFHYNFAAAELMRFYRSQIGKAYSAPSGFSVSVNGKKRPLKRSGYWINPISASRFPDGKGRETIVQGAEILHCRYLELASPLQEGDQCEITNPLGEKIKFVYSDSNRSEALKINQVGYAAEAGRKYAYLGIWRGPELGPRDYSAWCGKEFLLLDAKTGKEVFRGKISRRIADAVYHSPQTANSGKSRIHFAGEEVFELDFSRFGTPGLYRVQVPGVGSSWPFLIGSDAIGEAFYVRMRGMYQKRCGTAKDPQYTHWPDAACHRTTYRGNFPPNERHYRKTGNEKKTDGGFFNDKNERVGVHPFDVIRRNCGKDSIAENVFGGWHDAADYDRRGHHLRAVEVFVAAYLMFPQNFSDGQLNLPESGNGVPDLLDEAVWGMEVWRKAQDEDGGVGGWIETTSHPGNGSIPDKDAMPYFLSFPTRESTAEYAAGAAALALALKKAGDEKRASLFLESARKGYAFALDPSKRKTAVLRAEVREGNGEQRNVRTLTYRENAEIAYLPVGKAAFNLYLLTGEKNYLADFKKYYKAGIGSYIHNLHWQLSPFYFAELGTEGAGRAEFAGEYAEFKQKVIAVAEERLKQLNENYAYRTPWYPPNHPYVTHMQWGNSHPMNRGLSFAVAWFLTGNQKYRDAAFLCNDWQLGVNPLGRSMTSGLGKNYPVRFLDLPSQTDGIAEYVPGITPYTYTFRLDRNSVRLAYGLYWEPRRDHNFSGMAIALLPGMGTGNGKMAALEAYASSVERALPVFRRFGNVENWSVPTSEYSVWETIAPAAALSGCLLSPGWKPSESLKNRKPVDDLSKLPGIMALP